MPSTEENLKEAFAGESQARNKYTFFAEKAEEEGNPGVAKLFRATALTEKVHAKNHFSSLGGLKSTQENLKTSITGENYEHEEMYPKFIETAREEEENQALKSFDYAMKVEEKHEGFYKKALEAMQGGEDLEVKD